MCHTTHVSVITQEGDSALMRAARGGKTEVVVELVKAGANVDMQNGVRQYILYGMCTCVYAYTCYCVRDGTVSTTINIYIYCTCHLFTYKLVCAGVISLQLMGYTCRCTHTCYRSYITLATPTCTIIKTILI